MQGGDDITEFSNQAKVYALAKQKAGTLGQDVFFSATASGTTTVFADVPLGYYLFYPEGTSNGLCNLTSTDPDAEIDLKGNYPTVDKTIVEEGSDGVTGSSYTVGDVVDYQLKAVVSDMTGYNKYHFIFKDNMSKGLTFDENSVVVKIGGVTLVKDAGYALTTSPGSNGSTDIKIVFLDFYANNKDKMGEEILVNYSATVNQNAVTGAEGNSNNASIVYSNNPNHEYTGENEPGPDDPETETPIDPEEIVKIFVFDMKATKVDGDVLSRAIPNAEFSLWTTKVPKDPSGIETKTYNDSGTDVTLYLVSKELKSDADGKFNYKIGSGKYYLFEEKAPAGYILNDEPLVFTVTAIIEDNELTGITVDPTNVFTHSVETGVLATDITNFADSSVILPGTGGMGTKIFMMGGGLLMFGSIAGMLISSKRKAKKAQ
jgi:fimbrial isopeptide formation D2 family protein